MIKLAKYTQNEIDTVKRMYAELREDQGNRCLDEIAEVVGRTVGSVRSKLVQEREYVKNVKPASQPKDEGPTKAELIDRFVATVGKFENRDGLKAATKATLFELIELVTPEVVTEVDETALAA